jgi:hypothetical protein
MKEFGGDECPTSNVDELVKSHLIVMNNVGRAIALQLWWEIAHPTSFMLNFRLQILFY